MVACSVLGCKSRSERHIEEITFHSRTFSFLSTKLVDSRRHTSKYASFIQQVKTGQRTKHYSKVTHCIFDLDGTILDSEEIYHKVLKDLCRRYGRVYTKELEAKNYGGTDRQICINVVNALNLAVTAEEFQNELETMCELALPHAPLKEGAERLLTHLYETGVPLALATNSTRRAVRLHAASRPKLFGMFHHMVSATDPEVDRGKPNPDIFLVTASKFPEKPKPVQCLVFEDSLVGVEAAVTAGMQVVLTPTSRLQPALTKKATIVLKSLLEFKPEYFGLPPFNDNITSNFKKKF